MEKIKVYLQYPWKFPDSPYYKYLIENPPKNIEYVNAENQKGVITKKSKFFFSNKLKKYIRNAFNLINFSIPNAHRTKTKEDYSIIHCAHCLSLNRNKPWIADFEGVWQMHIGNKTKSSTKKVKQILERENCKKIMPWTETTANEIIKDFPEIESKIEVLYPTVPVQKTSKKKGKITILYVTRYFWLKGGLIALETYKRLHQEYGSKIKLIFISDVPDSIKKKYSELEIKNLVQYRDLQKYYSQANIFFYPSLVDTFGFSLLEAMSFGLPIVALKTKDTKSIHEIVINNKNGFLIDVKNEMNYYKLGITEKEIVNQLKKQLDRLIKNKKLREKMSRNGIEMIKNGKFSIKERNIKLKRIYEEILK